MKCKPLKLYVWHGALRDYSAGVIFALATSPEHARRVILKKYPDDRMIPTELTATPECVTRPDGYAVWGGG